ncbi:hypothetical protein HHL16_08980 [Pseudoflavitalea sp. G-6-1-2]|uniref:hypothetical protein n=1 Tax=Pseudoflavitalea sp. G-6-1-2 TaxID=2728841 RepID=UPI00146DC61E|nr:hypothetical protein [Pseudoflavitalea sp. G-6-1-2]NML21004.1 hypothetical protein [Pseudoflavitalea sp. G-6-1-2]
MKKIYMLTVAWVFIVVASGYAQSTKYWRGPAGGNWNNVANWSDDGISTPASSVPGPLDVAIFNQGSPVVNVDFGTAYKLKSLVVTGNITVKLVAATAATIDVSGDGSTDYGLKIDAGSRLEDSTSADVSFKFNFADNSRGLVNGTWYFGGHSSVTGTNGPTYSLPVANTFTNRLDVNGTVIVSQKCFPFTGSSGSTYIYFNDNSEYRHAMNGVGLVRAKWAVNSTIRITGITTNPPATNMPSSAEIGNLVIDCPNIVNDGMNLALPNNLNIKGNLQFLNTNNKRFEIGAVNFPTNPINYTIEKNLEISANSNVSLGGVTANATKSWIVQVNGNFIQSGGTFNIRDAATVNATAVTELKIKGNMLQTAGTFGAASTANASATDLFVVELNGAAAQTVGINSGTIDNAGNYVMLRINNSGSGITLTKPLAVGRLIWTGNKGKITASAANALTVNNPALTAVSGQAANGYVAGKMIRRTNQATAYELPVGGAAYRPCHVIPNAATVSSYAAEYVTGAYSVIAVTSPLTKVSNSEYWNIDLVSGVPASVQLTLNGAVNGASALNEITVAHFNTGTNKWESAKGATGTVLTPGNSSSGTVKSDVMNSFSPFTFGVLPGSALPVYLVSFNAKKLSSSTAKLEWTITTNSDPDRFEILRSDDGINFRQIGTVRAVGSQLSYTYQDDQLPAKTAYYKLRMLDVKGLENQSRIVTVFNSVEGLVINSMLPTLVTSQAKLNISTAGRTNLRLAVTDMYGRVVYQQQTALAAGSQDIFLQLGQLAAGAYQVTGYLENGQRTTSIRFIKQ